MTDRVIAILGGIDPSEMAAIAAGVLGVSSAKLAGEPTTNKLAVVHADPRTLGVLRVSGEAVAGGSGEAREWSAVAKVIDLSLEGRDRFLHPEQELLTYAHAGLGGDGLRFRPARCYAISRPAEKLAVLWLEDLTGAEKPPFPIARLAEMARHLGTWNAFHARERRAPPVTLPENGHLKGFRGSPFDKLLERLAAVRDTAYTRDAYGAVPVDSAARLHDALGRLNERTAAQPRSLAFGDCNIGNLFFAGGETVAVDWASLTLDPVGVDAGRMIGSASTWGRDANAIVPAEAGLLASYAEGLAQAGASIPRDDVRRAYLCQFASYLLYTALVPALLDKPDEFYPREFFERRYGTAWEDIPKLVAPTVAAIPRYIAEIESLLA